MAIITLPGLIDPHVHLRDPGQTHKEDFYTGTCAALAGGYTTIIDMPNNKVPITTVKQLEEKQTIAKEKIVCDVGFHFGSLGDNVEEFGKVQGRVLGLKLYLNETTGNFLITKDRLREIFKAWPSYNSTTQKPILLHAEDDAVEYVIKIVEQTRKRAHFCHISTAYDLRQIMQAKEKGLPVTCGVTPHHLFLTEAYGKLLGPFGKMKPPLRSKKDVAFLWKNLQAIDVIESDHAPHTLREKGGPISEKMRGDATEGLPPARSRSNEERLDEHWRERGSGRTPNANPPFGIPGLETTLPLLLTAVSKKKLKIEDIIRLCYEGPRVIFGIKTHQQTYSEIDLNSYFLIRNSDLHTKCGWSPFNGWKAKGKVKRVFLRGKKVFEEGKILAKMGSGHIIPES